MIVELFSTPFCAKCNVIKRQLESAGITHEVINVIEEPEYIPMYEINTVPVLIIKNYDKEIVGRFNGSTFDINTVKELVNG